MAPIVRALAALAAATLFTQVTATTVELPPCLEAFQPFTYSGCFQEKGTQNENALDFRSSSDQTKNTVEKCVAECKGNSYRYAGLTYHGVCYCSQTVNSPLLSEASCNMPCTANSSQTCGGDGAFSVWQDPTFPSSSGVSINDFESIGCYTDDTDHGRTIAERQDQVPFDTMTPSSCLKACADDGYPFAGVEFGGECYCGVVMGNYTKPATMDNCNTPCKGDSTKNCGGAGYVEIFVASKLKSLEPCGYVPPVISVSSSVSIPSVSIPSVSIPSISSAPPSSSTTVSTQAPPSTTTRPSSTTVSTQAPPSTTTQPTTTAKPSTTSTAPQVCTTTIVTPATCEYGCGNWCNKNLPDFDDNDSCTKAHNRCKLQVSACLAAGWPGSAGCMDFKAWCSDINTYCSSSCKGKGSCSKKDCFSKKAPKGYKPGTTSVSTFACPSKPTSTSTPVTTVVPPPPTGVCKQPTSWWFGYGPGNPVGGIEIPIVTCNDIADDFKAGNQFKLYTKSDSRTCKSFGRNNVPNACQEACKEQYDECQNTYAEGCKTYNNRRGRRDAAAVYARAPEFAKRWFFLDTFSVALNKCKIQYTDCLAENRNSYAANKCGAFATGY
ncbi:putative fungistatic metabolite [Colletotrichum liriopes]|uniref:Fungistatic metabolite n=1 Tax=Colletotrichum liriopes TaxID=708192 RepID=A0AA37GUJ5_9PEZI|nr:putative fungistatic metabolite [Colletotrichum liriopes]